MTSLHSAIADLGRRLDEDRLNAIVGGVTSTLHRLSLTFDSVLAGGADSVVLAASRDGRKVVVKATVEPADAAAEAELFSVMDHCPKVVDLDEQAGVLVMSYIEGLPLVSLPVTNPAEEWKQFTELCWDVAAVGLDPWRVPSIADRINQRRPRFDQAATETGRQDLVVFADRAIADDAATAGALWVPFDIHPKNIIVNEEGWWLIDPMPSRGSFDWCFGKWVIVRRAKPGNPAGSAAKTWIRHFDKYEAVCDAAVWEVAAQRTPETAATTIEVFDRLLAAFEGHDLN